MKIMIDADACPRAVKDILFRVSGRLQLRLILVANQPIPAPSTDLISAETVTAGFDVADDRIVELTDEGDLVITADIPLAGRVIEKNGFALNPRGELYTKNTIGEKLMMRNLMTELRDSGTIEGGGPDPFGKRDILRFAQSLDKFLAARVKTESQKHS
jgi:uncharacterized protein YaiI (UPF0178 family)